MKRLGRSLAFFAVLIAVWEALVLAGVWSDMLMASPTDVARYLVSAVADGTLGEATLVTLRRLALGWLTGVLIGVPMGLLMARRQWCADTFGVLALGMQALPSVCWAPLALIWFGQTETAMFFIVLMGSVWSIALAAESGVRNVPPIYVRAARTMGSRGLHTWTRVILPASLPFVVSGMKQGWAFAWRSLMAAEIFITIITGFGLGFLLHYGREFHAMDTVLGIMIVVILVGLLTDKLLFAPFERFIHRRWGTNR